MIAVSGTPYMKWGKGREMTKQIVSYIHYLLTIDISKAKNIFEIS